MNKKEEFEPFLITSLALFALFVGYVIYLLAMMIHDAPELYEECTTFCESKGYTNYNDKVIYANTCQCRTPEHEVFNYAWLGNSDFQRSN